MKWNHTIRGVSGALYLQSAIAGENASLRVDFGMVSRIMQVLRDRFDAISCCESCQAGNRAALSKVLICAVELPVLSLHFTKLILFLLELKLCDFISCHKFCEVYYVSGSLP